MNNQLTTLDREVQIKEIPEQDLNRIILSDFTVWVSELLSLTDEVAMNRLEIALPAVKVHCWSMGFAEVKEMFEMYADNKLSIKPIPNYFDRILFGKIVYEYKQQKPAKKKEIAIPEISEAEKKLQIHKGIIRIYLEFKQKGDVGTGTAWVYDHLDEMEVFNFTREQKLKTMSYAKTLEKSEVNQSKPGAKNMVEMIEAKGSPRVINRAKRILLNDYFKLINVERLKDILNDGNA